MFNILIEAAYENGVIRPGVSEEDIAEWYEFSCYKALFEAYYQRKLVTPSAKFFDQEGLAAILANGSYEAAFALLTGDILAFTEDEANGFIDLIDEALEEMP